MADQAGTKPPYGACESVAARRHAADTFNRWLIAAGAEADWEPESADAGEDDAAAPEDSGVTNRRQGGTSIDGSEDGELLAGASAARDIVGGRRETALALEAEERSMLELVRAAAVQRERESEERDDEDPEHSSGPDRDLETTSSSIRL